MWTQLWLNYKERKESGNSIYIANIVLSGFLREHPIIESAIKELKIGANQMLHIVPCEKTCEKFDKGLKIIHKNEFFSKESFTLKEEAGVLYLEAADEKGVLYGVFHILRYIAMEKTLKSIKECQKPDNPLRMFNHWDNLDGSIERGYSGDSFFFRNNEILDNERIIDYARLISSVGINGIVINNVNVKAEATELITSKYYDKLAKLSEIFASYGISLYLSLNFASPLELGDVGSADPLDDKVILWWREKMVEVFKNIPNLGGFLVKADSEGRPGPFTYGRTQADGANMLADIVKDYGAIIIWRCFVYNCTQDWRDNKTDRARAGYDNFIEMDGDYRENVILQIKNGPMDFQVREPVSPLLGGLKNTNQILEVQIAQEYTGQQIDVCYLIPMFKEVLEFKTHCKDANDTVADIISGRTFGNVNTGIAAVTNTGSDENWTGNDLAAANLYGFGRLSYQTSLSAEEIAEEWIRMTISNDEEVVSIIKEILLKSREIYENYTTPLGIGWMVTPHTHYGPNIDGYEYSRWGTYHRANHLGIGVDRTIEGTNYVSQYYEPNATMYNNIGTCPEELLLFFHHVPYTYRLSSGKTLIQYIYDSHFDGVSQVESMIFAWETLQDSISKRTYELVKERFSRQLYNAKEWRDQVNSYFYRKCGIPDEKGRKIY